MAISDSPFAAVQELSLDQVAIDEGRVTEAQKGLKHWPGSGIHTLVG